MALAPWLSATPEGAPLRHLRVYALWPRACRQPDGGDAAGQGVWIRAPAGPLTGTRKHFFRLGHRFTDVLEWHHPSFAVHLPPGVAASGRRGGDGTSPNGRPCVVLISGGGYNINVPIFEGHSPAETLSREHGAVCLVVRYRVASSGWDGPAGLADCGRMLSLVHANAEAWGIDRSRIALYGASAGGGTALNLLGTAADAPDAGVALPAVRGAYLAAGLDPAGIKLEASCLLLLYPKLDMVSASSGYARLIGNQKVLGSDLSGAETKARAMLMSVCEFLDGGIQKVPDGSEKVVFRWPDAKLETLPPTAIVACDGDSLIPFCSKAFVERLNVLHTKGGRGTDSGTFAEYTELTYGKDVKTVHGFGLEEWSHEQPSDEIVAKGYKAVAEEFGVHQIYSRNGAISYIMWFREAWVCPPGWLAWFFVRIYIRWRSHKMVPIAKARGAFTAFLRAHC
jgi:acetyl esterase/lipase